MASNDYDLWVIPSAGHSRWFARLDWYLNWQLSKGLVHSSAKLSAEILRVMEENGIGIEREREMSGAPLMVASHGRLPAHKCVVMDYAGNSQRWLGKIHELIKGLQPKRLRIFLPKGLDAIRAATQWKVFTTPETETEFSTDEEATP